MGQVLGIVYRAIVGHLVKKAGFTRKRARTGAVTLIQRYGSALNLNVRFHMLFLDGVYVVGADGTLQRFRPVRAPTITEPTELTHTIAERVGRFLQRQGLVEQDAENSYLAAQAVEEGPMDQLIGDSITYRIAVGPQAGRRCSPCKPCRPARSRSMTRWVRCPGSPCMPASLPRPINARSQFLKRTRLCPTITRPAVSEKRLSLTPNGNIRYQLKTPYRDGTTHVIFEPLDFIARLAAPGLRTNYPSPGST